MKLESESRVERTLNTVDAYLAVALCGMAVAAAEQRTAIENRQVESRSRAKLPYVEITAKRARRPRTKGPILSARHTHDTQKRTQRDDCGSERAGEFAIEIPMKKVRFAELFFEEAQSLNDAAPTPSMVANRHHIDLEHVA